MTVNPWFPVARGIMVVNNGGQRGFDNKIVQRCWAMEIEAVFIQLYNLITPQTVGLKWVLFIVS